MGNGCKNNANYAFQIFYHSLDVLQLIEDHEFDCDKSVIVSANISHVDVDLRWDVAELSECVLTRNEPPRFIGVSTVPHKLMKPVSVCDMSDGRGFVILSQGKVALSQDYSQIFINKAKTTFRVRAFERQREGERWRERGFKELTTHEHRAQRWLVLGLSSSQCVPPAACRRR